MRVRLLQKWMGFIAVLVLAAFTVPAYATPILDFGIVAPTSGSISYLGGGAALVGTGISVDNVVGLDTLLNNNVTRLLDPAAVLNFTTGASTGVWQWGGGPTTTITLVGGVDLNNDGDFIDPGDIAIGTTLLTGVFGLAEVHYFPGAIPFHISGSSFSDFKNETLLEFYGLPTTLPSGARMPYSGNFNISFNAPYTGDGNAFTSTKVLSGDIANTPVPEPGTLLLLGSGLLGLAGYGKVRFRRKKK